MDQGVSSATNSLIVVAVASAATPHEFGIFSVAFVVYVLCLGTVRSITGEPLLVRFSDGNAATLRDSIRGQVGAVLLLSLVLSAVMMVSRLAMPDDVSRAILSLAVCLPGLMLQDGCRLAYFASGRPLAALLNDLIWAALVLVTVIVLPEDRRGSSAEMIAYWGASGTIAALIAALHHRATPRATTGLRWILSHRDLGFLYFLEFCLVVGVQHLVLIILASAQGATDVGTVKGAQTVLGPVSMLITPAILVGVRHGIALNKISAKALFNFARKLGAGMAIIAALWSFIVIFWFPADLGSLLFGDSWLAMKSVLLPMGIYVVMGGLGAGALVGLRSLAAARSAVRVRLLVGFATLLLGGFGAVTYGAFGVAMALATAHGFGVAVWWGAFRSAARRPIASDRPVM